MNRVEANKKRAWEEYRARAGSVESRPFKVSVEISRNCNFRCTMCPQSWDPAYVRYRPDFNMTPELFDKVAEEVFPLAEYVHLQGFGETVISPHWPKILESCAPYAEGRRFGLVTNLSRVDDAMWRRMIDLGFVVIFSCDGATRETFETIRRRSRFADIERNLRAVSDAMSKLGRGELVFLVTLQKGNYREMPLFVDMARRYGASRVTFSTVMEGTGILGHAVSNTLKTLRGRVATPTMRDIPGLAELVWGRARTWLRHGTPLLGIYDLAQEELLFLKRETLRRAEVTGVNVRFNDAFLEGLGEERESAPLRAEPIEKMGYEDGIAESGKVSVHQSCFKPYSYVVVNYRGDIGLCNHLLTDKGWKQMGSLRESSFSEIWNGPVYREARARLTSAQPDNPSCAWCFKHRLVD